MAVTFNPQPYPAALGPVEWQAIMLAAVGDKVSGMAASLLSGLTVRMAAGSGMFGGFEAANTANFDISSAPTVGQARIDRLVMRTTITAATPSTQAGVTVVPAIVKGAPSTGVPVVPALTQTKGVGVYETAIARWAVTSTNTITDLQNDGPGPGSRTWGQNGLSVPTGGAVTPIFLSTYALAAGTWGQAPVVATQGSVRLLTTQAGLYSVKWSGYMAAAPAGAGMSMVLPWDAPGAYFDQGGIATVTALGNLPADFPIEFRVDQGSGTTKTLDWHVTVARFA